MKIIRRTGKRLPSPMNAMCDIAFLLFVFIMVLSALNRERPEDFEYAAVSEAEEVVPALEIFVEKDGELVCRGIRGEKEVEALVAHAVEKNPRTLVAVSAHRDCPFVFVDRAVTAAKKGGCVNFLFSAEKF